MLNQEAVYRSASPILAATYAANLDGQDASIAKQMALLTAKHKELLAMPQDQSQQAYDKLSKKYQQALATYFGDTTYNPEEQTAAGIFGNAVEYISDLATNVVEGLTNWGNIFSNVYRSAVVAEDLGDFFTRENWDSTWDGNKVFDEDLEREIDQKYDATTRKIAKMFATGANYGQVLSSLETEEEFNAFIKFNEGDQTSQNALRDYEDAKISWGRSLARLIGLNPDIGAADQGLEGTLYKFVSGTADLAGDIAFDPLTYVYGFGVALKGARYGLSSLMKAENVVAGVQGAKLGFTQKLVKGVGLGITYDDAFRTTGVRKAFDEAGDFLKTINDKDVSRATKLQARQELKQRYTFFDDTVIDEFGKAKVFDAESALQWFKDGDKVDSILAGRVGTMTRQLPRHIVTTDMKQNLRKAVQSVTGYSKDIEKFTPIGDNVIETLEKGETLAGKTDILSPLAGDIKNLKGAGDRWSRMFERALIDKVVYVGGTDKLGRSLRIQSRGSIYTIARSILPKYHANVIADAFVTAKDEGTARRMVTALYDTIADSLGIARTGTQKVEYDRLMGAFKNPTYGEDVVLGDDVAKALYGSTSVARTVNPSQINGQGFAIAEHHLAKQAIVPNIRELIQMADKKPLLTSVSNTINHRHVQAVTDAWSALNLLPRLGLRSLLDENLFHYLTMPIVVMPLAIKGYQASITRRIVTKGKQFTKLGGKFEQKEIGVVARVMQKFFINMDEETTKKALSGGLDVKATIMENQLASNRIFGLLPDSEDARYISETVRYGHTRELENFSSGMSRSVNDGIPVNRTIDTNMENLNMNVDSLAKELKVGIDATSPIIIRNNQPDFSLNFMIQLNNRVDRNGKVGALAVQHMEDPAKAVAEIAKYFKTPEGKVLLGRYERAQLQSVDQIARDMYLHVRSVFQNDKGVLNKKLLDKVRTTDADGKLAISAQDITLNDLEEVADMLPVELMGYRTVIPSYRNAADFMQAAFDRGFQISDRQVATLSREPVYYAYNIHFRRQLSSQETRYANKLVEQGLDEKAAKAAAAERYTFVANELSLNRVLGFVDNPNVRSNAAFGMRNLARYYRAQEDFYRRAWRAGSNPATLIRLRLSAEGLDNAGFIHEDEYGEKYFFFPVDEIMYNVYAPIIKAFTGEMPKQPMPLQLTGKIKMITPSLDPESAMPTFSSPLMALTWNTIKPLVPIEWSSETERLFFGPYAENRTLGEALTPSALRKLGEVRSATFDKEISEQVTSAAMKAAAMYSANGMAPTSESGTAERALFAAQVQATARNIVAVRNLLGIFSPVSPSVATNADVPAALLDEGVTTWKSEFNNLVKAEYEKGNVKAYETALQKWTKIHPGRLAYTVSETETNRVASIQKTKQAVDWMKANNGLVKAFPQASMFLMPQIPGYDISAYAYLKFEGYIKHKPLEEYFEQIANVKAENEYFDLRNTYDNKLRIAATPEQASMIRYEYETKRSEFLANKPYLKLTLERSSGNQLKVDVVDELREMLGSNMINTKDKTIKTISKMVTIFDYYDGLIKSADGQSDAATVYKRALRQDAVSKLAPLAAVDANAKALYDDILRRLLGV